MPDLERKITRRELFSRNLVRQEPLSSAERSTDSIAILDRPVASGVNPDFVNYLASAAGILTVARIIELTRKDLFKLAVLSPVAGEVTKTIEAQIAPVEYERSLGRDRSFPWLGKRKGIVAAGLDEGGPWDKYDELDCIINGRRARSVYWPKMGGPSSTREWLTQILDNAITSEAGIAWTGYCLDAAAASYFAPRIKGPVKIKGIEFSVWDISVVDTMRFGGLARKTLDLGDTEQIRRRIQEGEAVLLDHSDTGTQNWWGLGREIQDDETVVITRSSDLEEDGLQTVYKNIAELRGAKLLTTDQKPESGYEGNFAVVDRLVGGLIVGTHRLV